MTRDSKGSGLSRWSRRKHEAKQLQEALERTPPPSAEEVAAPLEPATEAETGPVLTDADMPDLDSLTEDSDYSGFMSEGVSEELRRLALRKLFRSSVFNIRDGLDEYDEDYTTFEKLGDIVTCDMKHRIEMEEEKLREKLAAEAEQVADETETTAVVEANSEDDGDAMVEDFEDDDSSSVAANLPEPEPDTRHE